MKKKDKESEKRKIKRVKEKDRESMYVSKRDKKRKKA